MLLLPAPLRGLCLMPSARVGTERADARVPSSIIYLAHGVAGSCPYQVEGNATTVHLRISGSRLGPPSTCNRQMACFSDSQQRHTVLGLQPCSRSIPGHTWLPPQWEHTVNLSLFLPVSSSTAEMRQGGLNNSPDSYSFKEDFVQCGSLGMKSWDWGLKATQRELFASQEASEDTTMTTHSRGEAGDRVTDEQYRMHIHILQELACLS